MERYYKHRHPNSPTSSRKLHNVKNDVKAEKGIENSLEIPGDSKFLHFFPVQYNLG